jgi:hypothetical protein
MERRIAREIKTLRAMLTIYCRAHHQSERALCPDCEGLFTYAQGRLMRCPFQPDKPTCANCRVHCYQPEMRERVHAVMRYAGLRLPWRHPVLAVAHVLDRRIRPTRGKNKPGG